MKRGKAGDSHVKRGTPWAAVSLVVAGLFLATCSPNELLTDIRQKVAEAKITGTVATPVFSPAASKVTPGDITVTITVNTSGAVIYYTTDGSTPSAASTLYHSPFVISGVDKDVRTINAIARADNMHPSTASATYSFDADTCPITVDVSPANAGTVNHYPSYPATDYAEKFKEFALAATPNPGWGFKQWTGSGGAGFTSAGATTTVIVISACSVEADFAQFQLTTAVSPVSGGTVTPSAKVGYDVATNINATPATGYDFVNWTVTTGSGVTIGNPTSASTTVTLKTEDAGIQANFALQQYQLTVNAGTGGGISVPASSPVTVNYGAATTITAGPSSGYSFKNWTVTGGSGVTFGNPNSASTTVTLTGGAATIQANFVPQYTLTLGASTGGTVTTPSTSPVIVDQGASTSIVATPATGYSFVNWTVTTGTNVTIVNTNSASTTVTLGNGDATIQANFALLQYVLTVNAGTGGGATGSATVSHGISAPISATANTGYAFVNWTVTSGSGVTFGNPNSASTTVTLSAGAATLRANFIPQYALTLSSTTGGSVTTPSTSPVIVNQGAATVIVATSDPNNAFVGWTVTSGTGATFADPNSASTTVTLSSGNVTIRANFVAQYTLTLSATTGGSVTTPSASTVTVNAGAATGIAAAPGTGYAFVNWTVTAGSGATFGNANSASTTVTLGSGNVTIQANFIAQYTLTLGASTGGSVTTPSASAVTVNAGAATSIVATPGTGYSFVNWTATAGTGVTFGNANSASTTVTLSAGNATIQANFALQQYTLTITAGSGGVISVPASSPVPANYGAATSITAAPNAGWAFKNWTVVTGTGVTFGNANSASTTVTLTGGNAAISANFSNPGSSWTQRSMPSNQHWSGVTYGGSTFVAVASGPSTVAATSPDGITWTQRLMPSQQSWNSVAYGGGIFAAVVWDSLASSSVAASSPDGVTWTQRAMPTSKCWNAVTYGGGRFVAVPGSALAWPASLLTANSTGATSTDGIAWTSINLGSTQNWYSVCYGNGLFVAVAYNSNVASYSSDGVNWTTCSLPASRYWTSVTYGNGTFVAVAGGPGGATSGAASSTDGIHWTARTMSSSSNWQAVAYGNGYFTAVSWNTTTVAATSPNGITWTSCSMPSAQIWESVTWAGGVFVAVAYGSGVGATSP
jgi:hypothetical protein